MKKQVIIDYDEYQYMEKNESKYRNLTIDQREQVQKLNEQVEDLKKEVEVLRRQSDDKDLEIIKLKQLIDNPSGLVADKIYKEYDRDIFFTQDTIDTINREYRKQLAANNITGSCVPGAFHLKNKKKAAIEYYVVDRQSGNFPPDGTDYPDGTLMVRSPLVVFSGDIAANGNVHAWVRNTDKLPTSKKH